MKKDLKKMATMPLVKEKKMKIPKKIAIIWNLHYFLNH